MKDDALLSKLFPLIVPYGIETRFQSSPYTSIPVPLIVPYGIETVKTL